MSSRFLLALHTGCYPKMVQINVNRDEMPKTLLGDQRPAVWNTRISYQLTWLSGLNIFLSITAVLGNALILVALSKMLLRCLSTTDLLVGLLSQPMYAAYEMSLLNGSLGRCRLTFFYQFYSRLYLKWSILVYIDSDKLGQASFAITGTEV